MDFQDSLKARLGEYIRESYKFDVVEVTDWEDETVYGGYCDTCAYETVQLKVHYIDSKGDKCSVLLYDSFAEIIRYL